MFDVFNQKNRILLRELIKTDFKLRYQGSAIGYLWSILKPLMTFTIMYIVFIRFLFPSCPLVGQCNLGLLLRSHIYGDGVDR